MPGKSKLAKPKLAEMPRPAVQPSVREAVYALMRSYGMTTVFGNPGSTELRFFHDWPSDFRYVLALQETSAVAMADAYAQARGNAALVSLHSAGGAGHAMGSIFTAYRNQAPLVVTAGQQTRAMFPTEPYLYASDAAQFPRPYVKWSVEPARAEDVPAAIGRAYHVAMQKPWGPVFVSIPEDDWKAPAAPIEARAASRDLAPEPAALAQVARALEAARKPLIVVGAAVDLDGAWQQGIELAERLEAPVWASPLSGRCSFPEDHRLFAGFLMPVRRQIVDRLRGHDLVLVLGAPVFTYHVYSDGPYLPAGTELIHISDDPEQAARSPVGFTLRCTLRLGLQQLLAELRDRPRPAASGRTPMPALPPADPIDGGYVMQQVAKLMPADAIIVEEAPSHRIVLHDYLPIKTHKGFYAGASGCLGWALPAAVGVALAEPDRKVICLVGDGSSLYSIQGMWTAVQAGLAVTFIVFNNQGYGALKSFTGILGVRSAPGCEVPGVDYVSVARGFGVKATRVERASQLTPALRKAFAATEPTLVEVMLDRDVIKIY
jgi:benzoylformate decarboxylase